MRKFIHAAAAASVLLPATACQNLLGDGRGALTGTWRFTATGYAPSSLEQTYVCDLQTTYTIRQEGNQLEGRSEAATSHCRDTTTGRQYPGEFKDVGVVRGPVDHHFDISDSGNWHCVGTMPGGNNPTRIEGQLESYGWTQATGDVTFHGGSCVLEKLSDAGYDGPAA
jgi:hypothetical protein